MDQRLLIFVALICLSSPSYGRSWRGYHPSYNGFAFKPHHNHKVYGDQETDYDSSEEDWDHNDDYTNYHRHDYGHHGYHHHVNHDDHHGNHDFDYHQHNHHNFGNVHNHGRHESHDDRHDRNNPELGTCRHNHDARPNYQDHGQNNDETLNGQNRGTTETPQNSQGNILVNNEPNVNPRAIDRENREPTADTLNIGSSDVNSGSPVTEPPKSGLPNGSPDIPREVSTGDFDRVVFPDSPPAPITSSPLQPRLLSTPEPTTQAPLQNLTTQAPITEAPVQAPTTPALLEVVKCVRACPVTSEYNPVCGNNNVTYNNPGLLQCARNCGVDVSVARQAPCPRAIPLPLLKLIAETFNITMEEQRPRPKRASDVVDDVTNSKKTDTIGKHQKNTEDLPKLNFTLIEVLESAFDDDPVLAKKLNSQIKSSM